MPLMFYPHPDDTGKGTLEEQLELLMEAAQRYKAFVLDEQHAKVEPSEPGGLVVPRDFVASYNWDEISRILREVREMSEGTPADKSKKAAYLKKLAEIYEVLRAAKMSKLEAVRLALVSEANQLAGTAS